MLEAAAELFPRFARLAGKRELEHVLPPATTAELNSLEQRLGLPLPESYKLLLRCARSFWLMGGVVQFGSSHPFIHDFPPLESLTPRQRETAARKGSAWPPPSQGMLCFAEFFMEADGDQVLFDTRGGLVGGEYPVMYWAHEDQPPSIRKLAQGFGDFMESFLDYPAFARGSDD